jgi:eukaryotic-like serine/threonine-protein kinase
MVLAVLFMEIIIMIRHPGSYKHASSRGKDYSVTAPFTKGGEASATVRFLCLYWVWNFFVVGIMVVMVFVSIFVLPSLRHIPSSDSSPALCSGNFQSASIGPVATPPTSTSPDGEPIGLSEGANIFDLNRPNQQEVQYKLQAALATTNNPQDVMSSLEDAIKSDPTDAEAQIYLENWQVLTSNHPHITLVVGVNFMSSSLGASRSILQGSFTAQKECNDHSKQDGSRTQIVLMIANIGGNNPDDRAQNAKSVADQIVDQAAKDPTIVAIMGWPASTDSINVNHQLKIKGSPLPMLSPSSSSDELQGMFNFFRVCPTNREQVQMAANFLLNTKLKKKIAILYDETTSYGNNLKSDFAADIPATNIVRPAPFTGSDAKTLQDALMNVLVQSPDAIFFSGQVSDLVVLLKNISSIPQANNLPIVGGDPLAVTSDYSPPLPNMRNVYFTAFASPNEWDGISPKPPFFQAYQDHFKTTSTPVGLFSVDEDVMLAYDAVLTLLHGSEQVLSTQNTLSPYDLTKALRQITVTNPLQGVTGRVAFDGDGDQDPSKMIFVEHIEGTNLVIDETHGCLRVTDNCSS